MTMSKLVLSEGETEIRSFWANRSQVNRAVAGHLYLTDRRLVFHPSGLDAVTGGHAWEIPLAAVTTVDIAPRGRNRFDGSLRRRLRITSAQGAEHFVVNKVGAAVDLIEAARQG
jgi:hypothetical protein